MFTGKLLHELWMIEDLHEETYEKQSKRSKTKIVWTSDREVAGKHTQINLLYTAD